MFVVDLSISLKCLLFQYSVCKQQTFQDLLLTTREDNKTSL